MNKFLKRYMISVEGIDKSGKFQIERYIDILGKHKYVIMDRGVISNISYTKYYNRDYQYDITSFKDWIFVYLTVDKEDWQVRCKITNEEQINYEENKKIFDDVVNEMKKYDFTILEFNTSNETPYKIAKNVIEFVEKLNADIFDESK